MKEPGNPTSCPRCPTHNLAPDWQPQGPVAEQSLAASRRAGPEGNPTHPIRGTQSP